MSKIRHKMVHGNVDALADHFPTAMLDALDNILDMAMDHGSTVDWSTLQIEAPDVIEVRELSGARSFYSDNDLRISVDTITMEDE